MSEFTVLILCITICTVSAANLSNYLKTKFARFLLSLAKVSQHGTAKHTDLFLYKIFLNLGLTQTFMKNTA